MPNENANYTEVEAEPGDKEGAALEAFAGGMPYAFIVATSLDPLELRVASAHDVDVIRILLQQTLRVLPGGE